MESYDIKILSYNVCHELLSSIDFMNHCIPIDEDYNKCIENLETIISDNNKYTYDIIALQEITSENYKTFSLKFQADMSEKYHMYVSNILSRHKLFKGSHRQINNVFRF
jgi:mRNA deadenylase 3'-5' endonuclease subunit Ccr4